MRVLVDTNVLVSAVLKDGNPEAVILYIAEQPGIEWIVSTDILREYKSVLGRKKFNLSDDLLQQWFSVLDALTTRVEVDIELTFPRDQKDAKFLACAVVSDADFLITGDRDFSEAQKLLKTTILSVSMFKKLVLDSDIG